MLKSKVLVLGGDGFVGKNVSKLLKEKDVNYIVSSRKTGVDLRKLNETRRFFKKYQPDFIVNCAAHVGSLNYVTEVAASVILDNSRMILNMYEAVQKSCPKAILINPIANCAYPSLGENFVEDFWQSGPVHSSVFSYGSAKRLLWAVGESFRMQFGIRSKYLMVPNMYGPHDSTDPNKAHALNALVSKFVKAKRTKEKVVQIWGTGIAVREWLYAGDFARVIYEIIMKPNLLDISALTNVAQNYGLSVKELVDLIRKECHYTGRIVYNPSKPDGTPRKVMDDRLFRIIFPNFKFISLNEGIKKTKKHYEKIYPY